MNMAIIHGQKEHETFDRAKYEWAKKRVGKPRACIHEFKQNSIHDRMMDEYLQREGLMLAAKKGEGT
jgi:hypothetical protein